MKERPTLSEEAKARLEEEFNRDLDVLEKMLGENLDCKNFKQVTSKKPLNWVVPDA